LVERQAYLLELCRYVVLNPVRAGIVRDPAECEWSSYRATAGIVEGFQFVDADWILSQFGSERFQAQKHYRDFVKAGIDGAEVWDGLKSKSILGGEDFLKRMEPVLREKSLIKEIPRSERLVSRVSLQELLPPDGPFGKEERNELMRKAHLAYGYSFTDIGKHVGLHYATVSRIVRGR
jgi:putative transposase